MKKLTTHLFAIERFDIVLDFLISDEYKQQIIDAIHDVKIKGNTSASAIIALLQQQFSCIKSVALSYLPSGVMHVDVQVHEPLCFINHAQVLLSNSQLVEPLVFNSIYLAPLHNVSVAGDCLEMDQQMLSELKECVQRVPTELLSAYELEWVHENKLVLHDKQQRNFAIVCESVELPDAEQLARCNKIKQDLEKKGTLNANRKKQWIADVRFKNQIVVSGGTCNGKSIS